MHATLLSIHVTCANRAEAETISKGLLEKRWIACANIIDQVHSLYWWDDKIQSSDEVLVIMKTTKDRFNPVREYIAKQHSYHTPMIVAFSCINADPSYAHFVTGLTGDNF